jgi:uncharacterized protein (TIGR02246 family)
MNTMTSNYLFIGLLIFGLVQTFSANEVKAQSEADQLRAIEGQRLRSLVDADMKTASRLHADDFELIYPQGGMLSKEQYMQRVASGDLNYLEWEPAEIRVRLYGKSAVLRYQARLRISVRDSSGREVRFWHTDLYEKRKGQWQIVWSHATQIPDGIGADEAARKVSDQKQIVEVVQQWQDEWNRHDIMALAGLLAESADVVTVSGTRFRSRKEFAEGHTKSHAGLLKESALSNQRVEVKFIKPDIAIVHGEWRIDGVKEQDGTLRPPQNGIFSWVLEKRNESWSIIAVQNTLVR